MSEFLAAALGFPAALFGFALLVVIGYWLLALFGAVDTDGHAPAAHGVPDGGLSGLTAGAGLGRVPVAAVLSLLIALAWFLSLVGTVALHRAEVVGLTRALLAGGVLAGALVGAWACTWVLVRPLRRFFRDERPPSRMDFIGRVCVIRTGRVGDDFGQAEVVSDDGSTAILQVRTDESGLTAGSTALIFDYDTDGEFFRVAPFDAALDPGLPTL
ncbi:hypothetical protein [Streptomyces syringium]|uniref:hypothetical protein n=1 Tax=Streptomyces syringium TaxID=76729 RepID=UPI003425917D